MIFYCVGEKVEVKTFNGVDAAITAITNVTERISSR